jgi:hypothetical protein
LELRGKDLKIKLAGWVKQKKKAIPGLCIESGNRSISRKAVLNLHYQALAKFMEPNFSELDN